MTNDMELLREYFDLSDSATRKMLIKLDEAVGGSSQMIISLTSKLYDKIQEKVDRVDFSYVEASRGDITKIPHYTELCDCLDIIHRIVVEYKQDTAPVDTVLTAIQNLKVRTAMFKKAFMINAPLPKLTYNSIALGIVQSTSLLIATSIEYIKDPNADSFKMALDTVGYNKTRDNLLFNNLKTFNQSCANREFDKAMATVMERTVAKEAFDFGMDGKPTEVPNTDIFTPVSGEPNINGDVLPGPTPDTGEIKVDIISVKPADPSANDTVNGQPVHDKPFLTDEEIQRDDVKVINDDSTKKPLQEKTNFGSMIGSYFSYVKDKVWLGILNTVIPMVRNFVYQFEVQRQNAEDYYQMQADLLQMNAMDLQYDNTLSNNEKNAIYKKQMAQVAKFKKHANNLSIDNKTSEVMSNRAISDEARKFKADELDTFEDENDIYSNSSLF
jgi:hypothetical protein